MGGLMLYLYPSQIARFEGWGYVRGRDFTVYKCLLCSEDMDRCKCEDDEDDAEENEVPPQA